MKNSQKIPEEVTILGFLGNSTAYCASTVHAFSSSYDVLFYVQYEADYLLGTFECMAATTDTK